MTEVWIVTGGWPYEGFEVVSVWASAQQAEAAAKALRALEEYHLVNVERYEVAKAP